MEHTRRVRLQNPGRASRWRSEIGGHRRVKIGDKWMSREIVIEVLGKKDADELWGAGYVPVLPVTAQSFEMGAVLPAVIYLLRWGHRRGRGKLLSVYGKDASVSKIARS